MDTCNIHKALLERQRMLFSFVCNLGLSHSQFAETGCLIGHGLGSRYSQDSDLSCYLNKLSYCSVGFFSPVLKHTTCLDYSPKI